MVFLLFHVILFIYLSIFSIYKHFLRNKDIIIIELTLASSTRNWMVWNGISRKASRSFWIFARSRLRMDCVGGNDHLPGYLIRPSVKAEGSPKEAESIVGRTKSTPWKTKCDFYFQCNFSLFNIGSSRVPLSGKWISDSGFGRCIGEKVVRATFVMRKWRAWYSKELSPASSPTRPVM